MTTLGDIFEIPDSVHQRFVLRLTEGLSADKRKATLAQYVVTPQLVTCFEQALSLVGSAVTGNSWKRALTCTAVSAAARVTSWRCWI